MNIKNVSITFRPKISWFKIRFGRGWVDWLRIGPIVIEKFNLKNWIDEQRKLTK